MRCRASLATAGRSWVTASRYSSTAANASAGVARHAISAKRDRTSSDRSVTRRRRFFLDEDRALQHQRGDRADGCELRREQRADDADRQRNVDEHATVLVLDDDAADVALANDLLD